jgi:transposase
MGNKYLRRLLYLGAIAQVSARRRGEAGIVSHGVV